MLAVRKIHCFGSGNETEAQKGGGKFFGPSAVLTRTVNSHFTFHLSLSLNVTISGAIMRQRRVKKRGKFLRGLLLLLYRMKYAIWIG
jgi:hypothetical protein